MEPMKLTQQKIINLVIALASILVGAFCLYLYTQDRLINPGGLIFLGAFCLTFLVSQILKSIILYEDDRSKTPQ